MTKGRTPTSIAGLALGLSLVLIATSCGSSQRATRTFPQYVDEVARALGIAKSSADDLLGRTADDLRLTRAVVAERVLPSAETIRPIADDIDVVVADLRRSADEPSLTLEDFVVSVLCSELLITIQEGTIATPEEIYGRSVERFDEVIADELWKLGWLQEIEDIVVALQQGDDTGVAIAFTEAFYC